MAQAVIHMDQNVSSMVWALWQCVNGNLEEKGIVIVNDQLLNVLFSQTPTIDCE